MSHYRHIQKLYIHQSPLTGIIKNLIGPHFEIYVNPTIVLFFSWIHGLYHFLLLYDFTHMFIGNFPLNSYIYNDMFIEDTDSCYNVYLFIVMLLYP